MVQTSQDVLFIVLAVVVAAIGIFFCLGAYYVIQILRKGHRAVAAVQEKIEMVGDILNAVKEKVNSSANQIALITQGVTKIIGFIKSRKEKSKKK